MSSQPYLDAAAAAEVANRAQSKMDLPQVKLHVIRSATWDPISDWLVAEGAVSGVRINADFGGYARIGAQIEAFIDVESHGTPRIVLLAPDMAELSATGAYDPTGNAQWPEEAAQALAGLAAELRVRLQPATRLMVLIP